jgi:hypothetical protein
VNEWIDRHITRKTAIIIALIALFVSLLFTFGCAGMRTYSSNEEHCADGCWVLEQTPKIGPAWCRLENGEKKCVPAQ